MANQAAQYFELAEQFLTQSEPPLCGLATIAMILNSLNIDPQRVWQHPWRWYDEKMLQNKREHNPRRKDDHCHVAHI